MEGGGGGIVHSVPVRVVAGPFGAWQLESLKDPSSSKESRYPESQGPEIED